MSWGHEKHVLIISLPTPSPTPSPLLMLYWAWAVHTINVLVYLPPDTAVPPCFICYNKYFRLHELDCHDFELLGWTGMLPCFSSCHFYMGGNFWESLSVSLSTRPLGAGIFSWGNEFAPEGSWFFAWVGSQQIGRQILQVIYWYAGRVYSLLNLVLVILQHFGCEGALLEEIR